jgi:hypothetical protein
MCNITALFPSSNSQHVGIINVLQIKDKYLYQ